MPPAIPRLVRSGVSSALERYLEERPDGIRALAAARDVLRLDGPAELIERLAYSALAALPGARRGDDGLWRLHRTDDAHLAALVLRATGPHPPHDALLELGAARFRQGRPTGTYGALVRPDRPLPPAAVEAAGVDPRSLGTGRPREEVIERLLPLLRGARIVCFESERPVRFLSRLLALSDRELGHAGVLVLRGPLRRAGAMPPRGGLADAAATLRVPVPETGEAEGLALTLARIHEAAVEREIDLTPPAPRERFDFGRTAFGPELLAELPEAPGVYRFYGEDGALLYVGKARDLRARVTTYFGHRRRRRKFHPELMERLHRLEWEETGSELRALLREVEEIREHAPPYNVQRVVHERRPAGGDLVLFLPGPGEPDVDLLFLRAGAPVARATSDRRAKGMRAVRTALRTAYFSGEAPPPEDPGDAQIVATWLRSEGDRQNWLDVSEVSGMNEAARRVREFLRDPDLFEQKVFRR